MSHAPITGLSSIHFTGLYAWASFIPKDQKKYNNDFYGRHTALTEL